MISRVWSSCLKSRKEEERVHEEDKWAEVIEADAFGRFLEEGVTNRRTAESFRREILEKGATDEPDELYRRFRGRDPEPEALLRRDGVIS